MNVIKLFESRFAARCPLRQENVKLEDMLAHNVFFCDTCRDEMILEKTKGKEMIFTDKPPRWEKKKQNVSNDKEGVEETDHEDQPGPSKRKQKQMESKAKSFAQKQSDIEMAKNARKIEMMRSAKGAIKQYGKMGFTKEEALKKFIEDKKKEHPQKEKERVHAERDEMPWAPKFPAILRGRVSAIPDQADHQRYVAIVSNFLTPNPVTRFQQNLLELRMMDEKLQSERKIYQDLVLKSIRGRKKPLYRCEMTKAVNYILKCASKELTRVAGRYGAAVFDENFEKSAVDAFSDLSNAKVLHFGELRKINFPNERRRFAFSNDLKQFYRRFPLSSSEEYSLKDDELAANFALSHGVHVVLTSSAAITIMSRHWVGDSCNYLIPITVKSLLNQKQGRFTNVCFVGKPCIDKTMNAPSAWRRFIKKSIKLALYPDAKNSMDAKKTGGRQRAQMKKRESVENRVVDDLPETSVQMTLQSDASVPQESSRAPAEVSDDEERWFITDDQEGNDDLVIADFGVCNEKKSESTNDFEQEKEKIDEMSKVETDDFLGNIMGEMRTCHAGRDADEDSEHDRAGYRGACLSKLYSIFSIGQNGPEDINILIRANNDGNDGNGNRIAVTHKLEYVAEFGAERLSNEELLRDYFRAKFKDAEQIVRFRIHSMERQFLQKECYHIKTITADSSFRECISERVRWLKRVAMQLKSLNPGNYLLRKGDSRIEIYPEVKNEKVVLECTITETVKLDESLPPAHNVFNGIDEHIVLVYHIVQKRIPASFGPKKDLNTGINEPPNNVGQNRKRKRNSRGRETQGSDGTPSSKFVFVDYDQPE